MIRVGVGYDVHPLVPGRALILGGVHVPYDKGLGGHSDSDVLTHAIVDALLGAANLGDIGGHFPPGDPRFENADSLTFVAETLRLLEEARWRISNVDATIVAQEPRLAPHIQQMRRRLSQAMSVDVEQVSIKGKSTNGLGFEGRGEGVAALAVVLIEASSSL